MKRFALAGLATLAAASLAIGLDIAGTFAHEGEADGPPDETNIWAIARGGQVYDNWASVLELDLPEQTHPAYPADGKKTGGDTWRCKECHGWDYRGAAGAYGSGSHFTGIKGIREMVGTDPQKIHKIIMNDTHKYTEDMIPHNAMDKLSLFVSLGQIDDDLYIDRTTKKARGDAQHGATLFQTICAVCHGFDGKAMNFGDENEVEVIGTIAKDNPWEFVHKARFGQPGVAMVGLVALPVQDVVDILAYAQTLPEK